MSKSRCTNFRRGVQNGGRGWVQTGCIGRSRNQATFSPILPKQLLSPMKRSLLKYASICLGALLLSACHEAKPTPPIGSVSTKSNQPTIFDTWTLKASDLSSTCLGANVNEPIQEEYRIAADDHGSCIFSTQQSDGTALTNDERLFPTAGMICTIEGNVVTLNYQATMPKPEGSDCVIKVAMESRLEWSDDSITGDYDGTLDVTGTCQPERITCHATATLNATRGRHATLPTNLTLLPNGGKALILSPTGLRMLPQ